MDRYGHLFEGASSATACRRRIDGRRLTAFLLRRLTGHVVPASSVPVVEFERGCPRARSNWPPRHGRAAVPDQVDRPELEGDQLQSQACSSTADRRDKQALATSEAAKITDVRASVDALVGRVWHVYGAGPSRGSSAAESLVERAGAWDNVSFLKGGGVMGDDDLERPPPKAHSAPEIVAPTNRANVALPVGNITIEE